MIEFIYKKTVKIDDEKELERWIESVLYSENRRCGDITYSFVSDAELDRLNREYLHHTDYTDIISFDYTEGEIVSGEIFISVDRIRENAKKFDVSFADELLRVMAHGLLHYCTYNDKTADEKAEMRRKEDEKISMFHVEHSK